jgi:hypothetical protein
MEQENNKNCECECQCNCAAGIYFDIFKQRVRKQEYINK